ncbi:hypothetical protein IAT38_003485 [Cryptococcus sp. DSM 104549]
MEGKGSEGGGMMDGQASKKKRLDNVVGKVNKAAAHAASDTVGAETTANPPPLGTADLNAQPSKPSHPTPPGSGHPINHTGQPNTAFRPPAHHPFHDAPPLLSLTYSGDTDALQITSFLSQLDSVIQHNHLLREDGSRAVAWALAHLDPRGPASARMQELRRDGLADWGVFQAVLTEMAGERSGRGRERRMSRSSSVRGSVSLGTGNVRSRMGGGEPQLHQPSSHPQQYLAYPLPDAGLSPSPSSANPNHIAAHRPQHLPGSSAARDGPQGSAVLAELDAVIKRYHNAVCPPREVLLWAAARHGEAGDPSVEKKDKQDA